MQASKKKLLLQHAKNVREFEAPFPRLNIGGKVWLCSGCKHDIIFNHVKPISSVQTASRKADGEMQIAIANAL